MIPVKFEREYMDEEMIITVLMKSGCNGASVIENKWLCPSVNFFAYVIGDSNEIIKEEGRIEWFIERENKTKGFGQNFEQYGIYRLCVRKCIQKELKSDLAAYMNNRYLLVKVLEENVENTGLMELRDTLMKPVIIETPYGEFELDRDYSWFACDVTIDGREFSVYLETDDDNEDTANNAAKAFIGLAGDFDTFDRLNKEYAANILLDDANDWLESDENPDKPEEITEQMFIDAMEASEMTVSPDGSVSILYHDGGMFWGHVINVDIESDGTRSDAYLMG